MSSKKRLSLIAAATVVAVSLSLPVTALAGGGQVHRPDPDEGDYYGDGYQSEGDPVCSHRAFSRMENRD